MSRDAPFVVFGAGETARKGILCYPSNETGGWAAKIVQLTEAEAAKPGTKFTLALEAWEKGGKPNEAD